MKVKGGAFVTVRTVAAAPFFYESSKKKKLVKR
jgi:hypothetical protein